MVFESVLVAVLNRFLGPYVKNLDSSQLQVAIWSGNVQLEKLELKENALSQFDIPLRIFKGHLDKLTLKIPWKNLYNDPVLIEVDGVYIVAGPETAVKYDHNKDVKEQREKKQRQLKEIEEARKQSKKIPDTDPGFVEKLITQIVRNVQLTIKNIHIQYEDNMTTPSRPFAFGITLSSLLLQSTDSKWNIVKTTAPSESPQLIFKLVRLDCLAIYWNSNTTILGTTPPDDWKNILLKDICRSTSGVDSNIHYILRPLSGVIQIQASTRPGGQIPQLSMELSLHDVSVILEKDQYQDAVVLIDYLDRLAVGRKFRKYRPLSGTVSCHSRDWWHFAYNAVVQEYVKRKLEMWSWDHIKEHRKRCKDYVELYTQKLTTQSPPPYVLARLMDLEDDLDLFNITVCRQLAETKAEKIAKTEEKSSSWLGWASGWLGGGGQTKTEEIPLPTEKELQEEKDKLYKAIGYSEYGKAADYPKEFVAHIVNGKINKVSLKLVNDSDSIAALMIDDISVQLKHRPASKNISIDAGIRHIVMTGTSPKGLHPQILTSDSSSDRPLLSVHFELKPLTKPVDQQVKLSLQPVELSYDSHTINEIIGMFKLPQGLHFRTMSTMAASTLDQLKTQTRAGLQHAIDERKLLDLDILVYSPVILVPENGVVSESGRVLIVDLGSLQVTSDMKHQVPDVQEATLKELEEAFYDYFNVNLKDINIGLSGSGKSCREKKDHILKPLQLDLQLEKSLLPNDTRLPSFKIKCQLPEIAVSLSDKNLKDLLILLQSIPIPSATESAPVAKSYPDISEPVTMTTSAIVECVSVEKLALQQEKAEDSEEEFITASEGEDEEEESKPKATPTSSIPASSTKVLVDFMLPKITIQFSTKKDDMTLNLSSLSLGCNVKTWNTSISLTLASLVIEHGYNNTDPSVTILSSENNEHFVKLHLVQANRLAPHYKTAFKSTKLAIEGNMSFLTLHLQQQSIVNLLSIVTDILSVLKTKTTPTSSSDALVQPDTPTITTTPTNPTVISGEKSLSLNIILGGAKVLLSDTIGDVVSAIVRTISSTIEMKADDGTTIVNASLQTLSVTDLQSNSQHPKVVSGNTDSLVKIGVTLYKNATNGDKYNSLDASDLEITAAIEKMQMVVVLSFVMRLLDFVKKIHVNQQLLKSAKEAATHRAVETAKALREHSSTRIKLSVSLNAPEITLPLSATSSAAIVVDLGTLTISNKFQWASDVYPDSNTPLSSSGQAPLIDVMTISISRLQLYRVDSLLSHDHHVIIAPMLFSGVLNRNLSSWCEEVPLINLELILDEIKVGVNPGDYRAVMLLLESLKGKQSIDEPPKGETIKETTSSTEVVPAKDNSTLTSSVIQVKLSINKVHLSVESETQGEVVAVSISGLTSKVQLLSSEIVINLLLKSLEVIHPQASLYSKVVYCVENSTALTCQVNLFKTGVQNSLNTEQVDMGIQLSVGRLRVVALMSFLNSLMGFIKELKIQQSVIDQAKQSAHQSASAAAQKVQSVHQSGQRIKLNIKVDAPEILLPTHSTSSVVLVTYLGLLSLTNTFHYRDISGHVYEESAITLSAIEVYRSIIDEDCAPSPMNKEAILEPCTLSCSLQRNLSASWYHDMPTISLTATFSPVKVYLSQSDTQVIADILHGNLMEGEQSLEKDTSSTEQPTHKESDSTTSEIIQEAAKDEYNQFQIHISLSQVEITFYDNTIHADKDKNKITCVHVQEFQGQLAISSKTVITVISGVKSVTIDDTRINTTSEITRLFETRDNIKSLLEITFTQNPHKQERTGSIVIRRPQIFLNIEFILSLLLYFKTLSEPFIVKQSPSTITPAQDTSAVSSTKPSQYKLSINIKVLEPSIAILSAPNDRTAEALIVQTVVEGKLTLEEGRMRLHTGLNKVKIVTSTLTSADEGAVVLAPTDISLTFFSLGESDKNISVSLGKVVLSIAPSTVRLILTLLKSIQPQQVDDVVGETVPVDLWEKKPVDLTRWYFESLKPQPSFLSLISEDKEEKESHKKGEFLTVDIQQVSILVLQEHPTSGEVSTVFSVLLGCYSYNALKFQAQEWSGQLWAQADISLCVSYFNMYTDVWEPLLEPVVDKRNDEIYFPWTVQATVDKSESGFQLSVGSTSALQLTLSSSSISSLMTVLKAYQKMEPSLLTSSSDLDSHSVIINNQLGVKYILTITPLKHIKSTTSTPVQVSFKQQTILTKEENQSYSHLPGEIVPMETARELQSIISVKVTGYSPLQVNVSNSSKNYYHLTSDSKESSDKLIIVVHVDKASASEPTRVTFRSPLQLHNHLTTPIVVYWGEQKYSSPRSILTVWGETLCRVPLDFINGFLYFKPETETAKINEHGITWNIPTEGVDIHCPPFYIHAQPEQEQYGNRLSVSGPHHIIHLHYPIILHNMLPYDLTVDKTMLKPGHKLSLIKLNPSVHTKVNIQMLLDEGVFSGEVSISATMSETSTVKIKSTDDQHQILTFHHDIRGGTCHISVFSAYWMVNKTGCELQYSYKHFWSTKDSMTHPPNKPLRLFPDDKVSVRCCYKGVWSEWSSGFSLETVGSEGVVSCQWKERELQMGITVRLSSFSLSKIITITPFYLLYNKTRDIFVALEYGQPKDQRIVLQPNELVPFWPVSTSSQLIIDVEEQSTIHTYSAPFNYTVNSAQFIRVNAATVSAVSVHIHVTGSANIVTFNPYYTGAVPLQLVNTLQYDIVYGQATSDDSRPLSPQLLQAGETCMYTWDDPVKKQELLWSFVGETKFKKVLVKDGRGKITLPMDVSSSVDPSSPKESSVVEGSLKSSALKKQVLGVAMAGSKLKSGLKKAGAALTGSQRGKSQDNLGYWVSFTDNLQRVLLFTDDKTVVDRASSINGSDTLSLEVTLTLNAVGLSLVNDRKGKEIAYIGLPQSEVIWEVEKKANYWKPVEQLLGERLESLYQEMESFQEKKKGTHMITDTLSVTFTEDSKVYLEEKEGPTHQLRRSHFNGFDVRLKRSHQLTSLELKINKVQIDNQVPLAANPTIFYCYPPPPTIASAIAPKPFMEMSLVIRNNATPGIQEIQFLQVLIQEMGFTLDLDFVIEVANLFESLSQKTSDEELMKNEKTQLNSSLKELKVAQVSASTAKTYFKTIHLSPLHVHVSFSLDLSEEKKQEISFFADQNVLLKLVLDLLYVFVGFIGRAKDAELKLGYFELQERALTMDALKHRIIKHYEQQFLYQMYSVVLGLEVLGNPVGFLRGLTEGTIDLFYQPIQGAVVGPDEFLDGLALGTQQFIGGTFGGIAGVGARVTGVLGDAVAKLTFDKEFQGDRPQQKSFGQGLETLGKGVFEGVTGVVSQPVRGAKKEGIVGFFKGTGKGVLGLVFRPTGGIIDFTSATLFALQRKTQVGDFELTQLRTPRFIGQDKVVRPYSIHKSAGYALFLTFDNGKLYGIEQFVGYLELTQDPLKVILITDQRVMVLKRNTFFKKWDNEWQVVVKDIIKSPYKQGNTVMFPVLEQQSVAFGFGGKKSVENLHKLSVDNAELADQVVSLSRQVFLMKKTQ